MHTRAKKIDEHFDANFQHQNVVAEYTRTARRRKEAALWHATVGVTVTHPMQSP